VDLPDDGVPELRMLLPIDRGRQAGLGEQRMGAQGDGFGPICLRPHEVEGDQTREAVEMPGSLEGLGSPGRVGPPAQDSGGQPEWRHPRCLFGSESGLAGELGARSPEALGEQSGASPVERKGRIELLGPCHLAQSRVVIGRPGRTLVVKVSAIEGKEDEHRGEHIGDEQSCPHLSAVVESR
jgi:hypothetical protein